MLSEGPSRPCWSLLGLTTAFSYTGNASRPRFLSARCCDTSAATVYNWVLGSMRVHPPNLRPLEEMLPAPAAHTHLQQQPGRGQPWAQSWISPCSEYNKTMICLRCAALGSSGGRFSVFRNPSQAPAPGRSKQSTWWTDPASLDMSPTELQHAEKHDIQQDREWLGGRRGRRRRAHGCWLLTGARTLTPRRSGPDLPRMAGIPPTRPHLRSGHGYSSLPR